MVDAASQENVSKKMQLAEDQKKHERLKEKGHYMAKQLKLSEQTPMVSNELSNSTESYDKVEVGCTQELLSCYNVEVPYISLDGASSAEFIERKKELRRQYNRRYYKRKKMQAASTMLVESRTTDVDIASQAVLEQPKSLPGGSGRIRISPTNDGESSSEHHNNCQPNGKSFGEVEIGCTSNLRTISNIDVPCVPPDATNNAQVVKRKKELKKHYNHAYNQRKKSKLN